VETVVAEVQLLNFHIGFLDRIPVLWTVFAVILLVGAVYYFAVQHKKPFTACGSGVLRVLSSSRTP